MIPDYEQILEKSQNYCFMSGTSRDNLLYKAHKVWNTGSRFTSSGKLMQGSLKMQNFVNDFDISTPNNRKRLLNNSRREKIASGCNVVALSTPLSPHNASNGSKILSPKPTVYSIVSRNRDFNYDSTGVKE